MTAGADPETGSENFRFTDAGTRWSPSGKETAAWGVFRDRNFMRGTDGNNLFACSGGCDTSGGRTVIAGCRNDSQSSVPGIFGGIYEHSALCCLLSGFGTNGDIQDVNVKTGTVSDGPFNGTTDGFGGAVSFTIQNFQDDQMGPGSHAHIFPFR